MRDQDSRNEFYLSALDLFTLLLFCLGGHTLKQISWRHAVRRHVEHHRHINFHANERSIRRGKPGVNFRPWAVQTGMSFWSQHSAHARISARYRPRSTLANHRIPCRWLVRGPVGRALREVYMSVGHRAYMHLGRETYMRLRHHEQYGFGPSHHVDTRAASIAWHAWPVMVRILLWHWNRFTSVGGGWWYSSHLVGVHERPQFRTPRGRTGHNCPPTGGARKIPVIAARMLECMAARSSLSPGSVSPELNSRCRRHSSFVHHRTTAATRPSHHHCASDERTGICSGRPASVCHRRRAPSDPLHAYATPTTRGAIVRRGSLLRRPRSRIDFSRSSWEATAAALGGCPAVPWGRRTLVFNTRDCQHSKPDTSHGSEVDRRGTLDHCSSHGSQWGTLRTGSGRMPASAT